MILQYLILFACFVGILHNCCADDNTSSHKNNLSHSKKDSLLPSIIPKDGISKKQIIPDCYFGVDMLSIVVFTRKDKNGINLTTKNLTSSGVFRKDKLIHPVVILIHGFISSPNNSNYENLAHAMLKKEDVLIISIDWKQGACDGGLPILRYPGYIEAVKHTHEVGKYVANITKILVKNYEVPIQNIQIIGHSLGAHIAGFAGKEIQNSKLGKYKRITGLDPAGPLFSNKKCSDRLCKTDAEYVQILHTTTLIGTDMRLGNIDFYINAGHSQPHCKLNVVCSHSISVEYLTECIKHKCCLIGIPWQYYYQKTPLSKCTEKTCVCIGLNTKNYPAGGSFYVPVGAKSPYCYNKGVKL